MPGKNDVLQHMIQLEIESFLLDRKIAGKAENTIAYYQQELGIFRKLCENLDIFSIEDLSPSIIRKCAHDLMKRRSPGGLHAFGRAIKAFLNWFEKEEEIENWKNPIRKVGQIGKANQDALPGATPTEIKAMIAACGKNTIGLRNRAILYLLYDTGIRVTELCNIDYGDVDFDSGIIFLKKVKGGKPGFAFMGVTCKRELLRYLRHRRKPTKNEPLFLSRTKQRLTRRAIETVHHDICIRVGIESKPSPHDFRRAFTKTSLKKNDIVTVSRLMNLKDTTVIKRYYHQDEHDLANAHDLSSPADTLGK